MFQPIYKYFKKIGNTYHFSEWKSDESINPPTASINSLAPGLSYVGNKLSANFRGHCLKQDKITFNYEKIVNIYVFDEIKL